MIEDSELRGRMMRLKRFAAADWLRDRLRADGLEGGAGWSLALVDDLLGHVHTFTQDEVEMLTSAVECAIETEDDVRDMAEQAVGTIFEHLGLQGEPPADRC